MIARLSTDERGASLAEFLVALLIVGVLGGAATTAVVTVHRAQNASAAFQEDLDTSRIALDRLRRELRGARGVTADSTPTRLQIRSADQSGAASGLVTWEFVAVGSDVHLQRYAGSALSQRQTVARGLLATSGFAYAPLPPPMTNRVDVVLDVAGPEGDAKRSEVAVRLRNVEG